MGRTSSQIPHPKKFLSPVGSSRCLDVVSAGRGKKGPFVPDSVSSTMSLRRLHNGKSEKKEFNAGCRSIFGSTGICVDVVKLFFSCWR